MPDTMGIEGQGSAPGSQIAQFRSDGFSASSGLRVPFFNDAFARSFGFPDVRPINFITEATPIREERPYVAFVGLREVRYSRPGLVSGFNHGNGPIRGLYCQEGVFGGALFIVSGTTIYRDGTSVGTLPGKDLVRFAASPSQMIAVADQRAYLYDGAAFPSFTAINNGVLPAVADVAYLAGRFAFVCTGSATYYYSEINDGGNETGLDFASTNDSPADIRAVGVLNDQLVFFTGSTTEYWAPTSDPNTPYAPQEGRGFQRGIAARDTLAFADNSLFWVGENGTVYRSAATPERVSSSSIEDQIRLCADWTTLSAFVGIFEGHEFYVLNIPGIGTYAYDCTRIGTIEDAYAGSYGLGQWGQWASWGRQSFRGRTAARKGQAVYVGDDTTNDVWAMTVGAWSDGTDPLVRQASAFIKIEEGRPRMDSLVLVAVMGVGNTLAPGNKPVVEMRYSDDMGKLWSRWRAASLGVQGGYHTRAYWQRLGQMRAPGRLIQVRASDPVDVAFSHLELNAPGRPYDLAGGIVSGLTQAIVDPRTGRATEYFDTLIRSLISRTGGADDKVEAAHVLAAAAVPQGTQVVAAGGLQIGGPLGGNVGLAFYVVIGPVSGLPTAAIDGDWAYATDGLKPGETTGGGTGVPAFYSAGNWVSACSGATVGA